MADRIKKKPGKPADWQRAAWVFFKAQVSAQFASIVDFSVTILLATLFDVFYLYATFTGSVMGGVVNCFVNYRWAFHPKGVKKTHVAVKYLLVWGGNIFLNTWGTYLLTEWLTGMTWINDILGYYVDNVFIAAKVIVAVTVALAWNYHMQRVFVYRNHNFRQFWQQYFENKNR